MTVPIGLPEQLGALLPQRGQPRVTDPRGGAAPTDGVTGTPFSERVKELVEGVNATQENAEAMTNGFANGEHNDLHGTMIAVQQADITLRLTATIRNRVIEAYREVMRMGA